MPCRCRPRTKFQKRKVATAMEQLGIDVALDPEVRRQQIRLFGRIPTQYHPHIIKPNAPQQPPRSEATNFTQRCSGAEAQSGASNSTPGPSRSIEDELNEILATLSNSVRAVQESVSMLTDLKCPCPFTCELRCMICGSGCSMQFIPEMGNELPEPETAQPGAEQPVKRKRSQSEERTH